MAKTKKMKVKTKKPSKLKTGLKIAAGAVAAVGLGAAAVKGYQAFKGRKAGRRGRKKSAGFYAREIMRLKLKKRYDKLRLSI